MCTPTRFSGMYNNGLDVLTHFSVNEGKYQVAVKKNEQLNRYEFCLEDLDGKIQQLFPHDVICPKEMHDVPATKFKKFLQLTYARLVTLSDGSHKLSISFKLCGGVLSTSLQKYVIDNPQVGDAKLAEMVKEFIPENTYTSVAVQTKLHSFLGDPEVLTRVFTFSPKGKSADKFFKYVKDLLFGFGDPDNIHTYNATGMARYLLGLPDYGNGKMELETAFNEEREIYLFLSQDGKIFEVRVQQNAKGFCSIS